MLKNSYVFCLVRRIDKTSLSLSLPLDLILVWFSTLTNKLKPMSVQAQHLSGLKKEMKMKKRMKKKKHLLTELPQEGAGEQSIPFAVAASSILICSTVAVVGASPYLPQLFVALVLSFSSL